MKYYMFNLIRMFTYNNATTRLKIMHIASHVYEDRMFISMFTCKNATTRIEIMHIKSHVYEDRMFSKTFLTSL